MSRFAIRSSLAALGFVVAAAGLSGTAIAAPDSTSTSEQSVQHASKHGDRHGGHHHRGHGKHGDHRGASAVRDGFMLPGVGPLSKQQVESLKLDAKQQAAFDIAKQTQRDMFTSMRENRGKRHELLAKQLTGDKLDPHALVADQDAQRAALREQSEQVRGKWLAAWDGLNSTQQQQVTELVKARQAKMDAHRAKKQERQAKHDAERSTKASATAAVPAN